MLSETTRQSYPENFDNPMIAHRGYEVRQSERVLELQNKDLWIRPTDLSWHVPILVTSQKLPFKRVSWKVNCEFVEARNEAKKQKDSDKKSQI